MPTFADTARRVVEQKQAGWRGRRHAQNCLRSLERYAFPRIGSRPRTGRDPDATSPPHTVDESRGPAVRPRDDPWYDGSVFNAHAIAPALTAAKLTSEQPDAITDAVRQAAEHGKHVRPDMLRGDLTWRIVAVDGLVVPAVRPLG